MAAEMSAVAVGLWLLLVTTLSELGVVALLATCMVSFFVRLRHYATA